MDLPAFPFDLSSDWSGSFATTDGTLSVSRQHCTDATDGYAVVRYSIASKGSDDVAAYKQAMKIASKLPTPEGYRRVVFDGVAPGGLAKAAIDIVDKKFPPEQSFSVPFINTDDVIEQWLEKARNLRPVVLGKPSKELADIEAMLAKEEYPSPGDGGTTIKRTPFMHSDGRTFLVSSFACKHESLAATHKALLEAIEKCPLSPGYVRISQKYEWTKDEQCRGRIIDIMAISSHPSLTTLSNKAPSQKTEQNAEAEAQRTFEEQQRKLIDHYRKHIVNHLESALSLLRLERLASLANPQMSSIRDDSK